MFLVYGVIYIFAIAFISVFTRVVGAVVIVTYQTIKENKAQAALLKLDPNSKEYLSRYMPRA
jgi:hypothetical protein